MSSVKTIENPDEFRDKIRSKLLALFPPGCEAKHANNLEKGIHNWALKEASNRKVVKKWDNSFFVQIYLDHLRSIFVNLKNTKLIEQIVSGEIKSQTVAFMTHQEMQPEKWEELIRIKCIRDKSKFETQIEACTDTFTCRKCKSKKCSFMQAQTRSADEGITTYVQCLDCGCRWKC